MCARRHTCVGCSDAIVGAPRGTIDTRNWNGTDSAATVKLGGIKPTGWVKGRAAGVQCLRAVAVDWSEQACVGYSGAIVVASIGTGGTRNRGHTNSVASVKQGSIQATGWVKGRAASVECLRAVAIDWRGRACVGCSGAIVVASIGTGGIRNRSGTISVASIKQGSIKAAGWVKGRTTSVECLRAVAIDWRGRACVGRSGAIVVASIGTGGIRNRNGTISVAGVEQGSIKATGRVKDRAASVECLRAVAIDWSGRACVGCSGAIVVASIGTGGTRNRGHTNSVASVKQGSIQATGWVKGRAASVECLRAVAIDWRGRACVGCSGAIVVASIGTGGIRNRSGTISVASIKQGSIQATGWVEGRAASVECLRAVAIDWRGRACVGCSGAIVVASIGTGGIRNRSGTISTAGVKQGGIKATGWVKGRAASVECLRAVAVGWRGRACVGCSGAIVGASIGTGGTRSRGGTISAAGVKLGGIKAAGWVKGRTTSVECLRAVAVDWSEQACVGYSGAIVGASIVTGGTRNRGRTNSAAGVKQGSIKATGGVKGRAASVACLRAVAVEWRGRACVGCSGAIVGASIGTGGTRSRGRTGSTAGVKLGGIQAAGWVKGRATSVACLRAVAVGWRGRACVGYSGAIVGASIVTGGTRSRDRTNSAASVKHGGIKAAGWVKGRTTSVGCLRAVAVDWSEQACVGYSGAIVGASIVTGGTRSRDRTNSAAAVKLVGLRPQVGSKVEPQVSDAFGQLQLTGVSRHVSATVAPLLVHPLLQAGTRSRDRTNSAAGVKLLALRPQVGSKVEPQVSDAFGQLQLTGVSRHVSATVAPLLVHPLLQVVLGAGIAPTALQV